MASRAVIIGPASYAPDAGIQAHDTIRQSALMYEKVLNEDPLWGPDRVTVLPEDDLAQIVNVMNGVQKAANEAESGDTLLVIYVGHGRCWADVPDEQVHFAVNSSRKDMPYTWLSSWYLYRTMRLSEATLKVLIADCCYSNMLPDLGDSDLTLPGALGVVHAGTCVLTAVKSTNFASAEGCSQLPEEFAACTPFSGHLLKVLSEGTRNHNDELNLGLIRDAVKEELRACGAKHNEPRMSLNDAREVQPLFTNRMASELRRSPRRPRTADEWVTALLSGEAEHEDLLVDAELAGDVVARLWVDPEAATRHTARSINNGATKRFSKPSEFARYWARVERAIYT
jgi:hypothetical protein